MLIIYGSIPTPHGGVTTFCYRLTCLIAASYGNSNVLVFDPIYSSSKISTPFQVVCPKLRPKLLSSFLLYIYYLFVFRPFRIAWNGSKYFSVLPSLVYPRSALFSLILHSGSISLVSYSRLPFFLRLLVGAALNRFSYVVALSEDQRLLYESLCLPNILNLKPSLPISLPRDNKNSDSRVLEPYRLDDCSTIVIGSGYGLSYYRHDLFAELSHSFSSYSFHLFIYGAKDPECLDPLISQAARQKNFHIHFDVEPEIFNRLLSSASVYVRTSSVDSWGISVSDAISFGVPAVASDVCERDPSAILFETGSIDSLREKFSIAVAGNMSIQNDSSSKARDYSSEWVSFFSSLFE